MIIGIPKEIMTGEQRVAATPDTCRLFVEQGHQVLIEKGAGVASFFLDEAYRLAGGEIIENIQTLFEKAQLILKVKEPLFNQQLGLHEVDMMHPGQGLLTFIHPAAPSNHQMVKNLAQKGVTALTLDGVPRISRAQSMDALTSMSTCAGYKGMLIAANLLPRFIPQIFSAVGMIKPLNALIIGVGVGGLQALATAKRLGAIPYAVDIRPDAVEQAKSLGAKIIDVGIPPDAAVGQGGYALSLSKELLEKERELLTPHLEEMDIVFLSALVPGKLAPILVTTQMLEKMKPGSVVVDISIDQGGNCEATVPAQIAQEHQVHLVGIKNIPGMIPESATWMFAQNVYQLVHYLVKDDALNLDLNDEIVQGILTTYQGSVVHPGAREAMGV